MKTIALIIIGSLVCISCSTDKDFEYHRFVFQNKTGKNLKIFLEDDSTYSKLIFSSSEIISIKNNSETIWIKDPSQSVPFVGDRMKVQFEDEKKVFFNFRPQIACETDSECNNRHNPFFNTGKYSFVDKRHTFTITYTDSLYLLAK